MSWYGRWREARFDARWGIETRGVDDDLAAYGACGEHVAHAEGYEPIQPAVFRAILAAASIDPARYAFVDFGSGKGRALILAAEAGFRRILGIELAPGLHRAARRNIESYLSRRRTRCRFELRCEDAADAPLPEEDAFLFFYNPFGAKVLSKVADNIERAWRGKPRNLVIAYRNPVCAGVFDERRFLSQVRLNRTFALYRAAARVT